MRERESKVEIHTQKLPTFLTTKEILQIEILQIWDLPIIHLSFIIPPLLLFVLDLLCCPFLSHHLAWASPSKKLSSRSMRKQQNRSPRMHRTRASRNAVGKWTSSEWE